MPRALIVDDLPENLYLLDTLFKGHGYSVQTAADGAQALALAREEPPDIIITDILMPGMDGFVLCREWKQDDRLKGIPLVIYTATYTEPRDARLALSLGADLFLIKPLEPTELMAQIEGVLRKQANGSLPGGDGIMFSEQAYLREYNHALVLKLEHKVEELQEANRALGEREAFLQTVLSAVAVHVLVLDSDSMVVAANRAWEGTNGSQVSSGAKGFLQSGVLDPTRQWCGDYLCRAHRHEDPPGCGHSPNCASCALNNAILGVLRGGVGIRDLEIETETEVPGGVEHRWLVANIEPVALNGQRHAVAALHDITERKLAEEKRERLQGQLLQAQRMEAVGRLAGGVAHDFNNILQAMMSLATVLRLRAQAPELVRTTREIEALIKRGASLTQQLLLFSRRQTAERMRLELGEVVIAAATLLRRLIPERIKLIIEASPELLWTDGDTGQLQQVLMNLALNAKDAMPDGGEMTLRTAPGDGEVCLEVTDTGQGMDGATLARLFEPFFSTKEVGRGTGLGLAVVHGIVKEHGGRVEVDSSLGRGSRFRIILPASTVPEPSIQPPSSESDLPRGQGERVLIVEDEEGARHGLAELIELAGYQVTAVGTGEEACSLPSEPAPDLLLTDLVLPGITGPQLVERLRARWPRMKMVLMSGYTDDEAVRRSVDEGRVHFLQKPFDAADLARHFRAVFGAVPRP